jgi:AcrR family transcriptional regulator
MIFVIKSKINDNLFIKDPFQSELGQKIVEYSIILIDKIGFEQFTFKKLSKEINSTEASIYRYFENKHNLLVYIISWYWALLEFEIDYKTNNITDPIEKLKIIIRVISSQKSTESANINYINEEVLHKIVINESAKAYLTKKVDKENHAGYFSTYGSVCNKIVDMILEARPDYPFPRALASNLIETAHEQTFFAIHLKSLTDLCIDCDKSNNHVTRFLEHLVGSLLQIPEMADTTEEV